MKKPFNFVIVACAIPFLAAFAVTGCEQMTTDEPAPAAYELPKQAPVYGYQLLPSMDTLYITTYPSLSCGELHGGDTIGKIPFSDSSDVWKIVLKDNE